jgi:thymidylate kinase
MIQTKLILIEGIAGSGKTTTARWIASELAEKDIKTNVVTEFSKNHPVNLESDDIIRRWLKNTDFRWSSLSNELAGLDGVTVFECTIFQWMVGELVERGVDKNTIIDFVLRLSEYIKPLNPVLIYLYQADFEKAIRKIYSVRSKDWRIKVSTYLSRLEFGKERSQKGLDLYIEFNRNLLEIYDELYNRLNINKIRIENSEAEWDKYYDTIKEFLML